VLAASGAAPGESVPVHASLLVAAVYTASDRVSTRGLMHGRLYTLQGGPKNRTLYIYIYIYVFIHRKVAINEIIVNNTIG